MGKLRKMILNPSISSIMYAETIVFCLLFLLLSFITVRTISSYRDVSERLIYLTEYQFSINELTPKHNKMLSVFDDYVVSGNVSQRTEFIRSSDSFKKDLFSMADQFPDFPIESFSDYADSLIISVNSVFNKNRADISDELQYIKTQTSYFNDTLMVNTRDDIQRRIEENKNNINSTLKTRLYWGMISVGIIVILLIVLTVIANVFLKRRLKDFMIGLEKLTKQKDFTMDNAVQARFEELAQINRSVMDFVSVIKDIIIKLNASSGEIAAFSQELAASSQEVSSATEEVSASTENITSDIMLLKDYTDNMNNTVEQMNTLMENTVNFLNKAKDVNEEFMNLMNSETQMIQNSTDNFSNMEKSVENIKIFIDDFIGQVKNIQSSVDSIKKVHKKIELLSLNAAIEAARAGKEGGGFAVIAEEIRTLSSRSSEASKNIEGIMDEVISNIRQLHNLINESLQGFRHIQEDWAKVSDISIKVSSESENTYNETNNLSEGIRRIESQFEELSNLFKEIKIRIDNVVASSEQISSSNEEITSQMEELTSSSQELSEKAQDIKGFVDNFKV